MPGHHDAGNEYTSLEDAQNAALYAKEQGLGGKYSTVSQNFIHREVFAALLIQSQDQKGFENVVKLFH